MSQAFSGVEANVFTGALDMDASGWSADVDSAGFDSTTTADLGWEDETSATMKVSGSFDFFYNPSKTPTGTTANLTPGNTAALVLWVNKTASVNLSGNARIQKLSLKSKVKDGFMVTATFTSKGAWTLPS
jgi:hypothetical protein